MGMNGSRFKYRFMSFPALVAKILGSFVKLASGVNGIFNVFNWPKKLGECSSKLMTWADAIASFITVKTDSNVPI